LATPARPVLAGVSVGFPTLRRPLRRREDGESPDLRSGVVDRVWIWRILGVEAEMGRSPTSFCWGAASPRSRRRPRRRRMAAALFHRRFLQRRWLACGWCSGGRRRDLEAAAAGARGVQGGDLATSGEVVWRWPQVWGGGSLGGSPGRWSIFGFRSSFSELVAAAARQRLWARSFSVPLVRGAGGGFRRRLRRCRACVLGVREVEVVVLQLFCLLFSLRSIAACIPICTVLLLV
jgi:hypothetical protein